jgi:2-(3-amino-3-carboxypropyl)histidine synthase
MISFLPANYNFEILKSVHRIRQIGKDAKVFLQFPEGLLLYACMISDILTNSTECDCTILADVTYGACCVDDITANSMNADLLIHYGNKSYS